MLEQGKNQKIIEYVGRINYDNIGSLLAKLKQELDALGFKLGTYKKVLAVMVECLENIYKYMDNTEIASDIINNNPPKFILELFDSKFLMYGGNPILKKDSSKITKKIDKVNQLEPEKLKKLYKKIITNGHFTNKGGAGLGFIEMVKTTGSKLLYEFDNINEEYLFFNIRIDIPIN
jgi:hypothetical protein